jgi:hypothetical protein
MNNTPDIVEPKYGIFSDLPEKYAETLFNYTYFSDAFGVFNDLMNAMNALHNLDWTLPDNIDTAIQLSLDYLYPLLKAGKIKMMVPIVSLRTAKTPWEYAWVRKIDMPEDCPIWFVDKYIIYSKPEEAEDAISMVWLQWEKIKRDTTPAFDKLCAEKHFWKMREVFYEIEISFTLPHRPFWNDGKTVY